VDDEEMTAIKPYPSYRKTNLPWLAQIPTHWVVTKVKRGYDIRLGKMLRPEPLTSADTLEPYLRAANIQWQDVDTNDVKEMWFSQWEKPLYELREGDLMVCEGGDVGRAAIWQGQLEKCYIQNSVHRVRSREGFINKFLYYWLVTLKDRGYIDLLCNKATIAHFTADKFSALEFISPPLPEQRAIAAYLDCQSAKIDTLIAKKQRLLDLLVEQRTALISQVVTKGLNPDVKMKDSGVMWLGQVPSHWEVEKNKQAYREIDDRSEYGDEELLTVSHISGVTTRAEKEVNMFMAESMEGYKRCRAGDLAINTMWAWMGALGISPIDGIVSPSYNVYRFRKQNEFLPQYLDYLYRIPQHIMEIKRYSKGVWSSRLRLYPDEFFLMATPKPPYEEQVQIVEFLDKRLSQMNKLKSKVEVAIELHREYRTALISSVVTGKVNIA
jgi:type I restriction enzyme, S subunit